MVGEQRVLLAEVGGADGEDRQRRGRLVAEPLRSALLNGRSQANIAPRTDQVRPRRPSPSATSGKAAAIAPTSSSVAIGLP